MKALTVVSSEPLPEYPKLADTLRERLIALSIEMENMDNQLCEVVKEMVEHKKACVEAAKRLMNEEREWLATQLPSE